MVAFPAMHSSASMSDIQVLEAGTNWLLNGGKKKMSV